MVGDDVMKQYGYLLLAYLFVINISACYSASDYHGDGDLEDRGILEGGWRYILTVEEIDIGTPGHFEFRIFGLPSKVFHFGLDMALPQVGPYERVQDHLPCNPRVHFLVVDQESKEVVIDARGYIANDWTWNIRGQGGEAFIYMWDNGETSFKPESRWNKYVITVRVDDLEEESCELNATLVARSPGWK